MIYAGVRLRFDTQAQRPMPRLPAMDGKRLAGKGRDDEPDALAPSCSLLWAGPNVEPADRLTLRASVALASTRRLAPPGIVPTPITASREGELEEDNLSLRGGLGLPGLKRYSRSDSYVYECVWSLDAYEHRRELRGKS
jgi:hypothetical protein